MNKKGILFLGITTLILLSIVVLIQLKQRNGKLPVPAGEKLLGNIVLNDIEKIVVKKGGHKTTLLRTADGYRVEEKEGYFGDTGKIDSLIVDMLSLKGSEWITSKKEKFKTLGVSEESPDGTDVSFFAAERKLLGGIVLGEDKKIKNGHANPVYSPSRQRYVRVINKDDIFLTAVRSSIDANPGTWLDKLLLKIPPDDIETIEVRHPEKRDNFSIEVNQDGMFEPVNLNRFKGKEQKNDIINSIAGAMQSLRLIDVVNSKSNVLKELEFDHKYIATLKNGRQYTIYTAEKDQKKWLKISVHYSEEVDKKREDKKIKAAPKQLSPKEIVRKENKRFRGWIFEVSNFEAFRHKQTDLYRDK